MVDVYPGNTTRTPVMVVVSVLKVGTTDGKASETRLTTTANKTRLETISLRNTASHNP